MTEPAPPKPVGLGRGGDEQSTRRESVIKEGGIAEETNYDKTHRATPGLRL